MKFNLQNIIRLKTVFLIIVGLLAIVAAAFILYQNFHPKKVLEKIEIPQTNPFEEVKTNPFKDIKTNPFE